MVGDPVEDHVHALAVGGIDEGLEVGLGAELRVHAVIVADRIRAAERALAVLHADRVDRHQPQDIDADSFSRGSSRCAARNVPSLVNWRVLIW
jgi:hypothetical protein